jgi:hypothetical protein
MDCESVGVVMRGPWETGYERGDLENIKIVPAGFKNTALLKI